MPHTCSPNGAILRSLLVALSCLLLVGATSSAQAVQPDEILADPKLEKRARVISKELRCLVCQNQSIDDSNAPLARDLRLLVRERLKDGDTNSEVLDFVVSRYGEFVLLKPPLGWHTLLLWLTPALAMAAGLWFARSLFVRTSPRGGTGEPPLSEEEEARLKRILDGE